MKQKYIFIALFFLSFLACKKQSPSSGVGFRARIINARTGDVLVSKNFLFIDADTLHIENENEIKGNIHANEEGLYFIYIYPEFQTVYLKPGDSLAFHINIEEFDESLSFSGSLGFENNLLMELYLLNEKESEHFYQADFQFTPDEFLKKIDSFSLAGQQLLNSYQKELKNTSPKYKKIVDLWQKSLEYDLKETYLFKHPDAKLPENYTAYHQVLQSELSDPNIIYMYAFAENYIRQKHQKNINNPQDWYRETAQIIKNEIGDTAFRDNLLVKYCYRYIKEKKPVENDFVTGYYFSHIQNPSFVDYCQQQIEKNRSLQAGNKYHSIDLIDTQGKISVSDSLFAGKKVLLSFWDLKRRKNFISNLNKLKKIQEKFPALEIIIINTDSGSFDEWLLQLPKDSGFKYYQSLHQADKPRIEPYHPAQVFLIENDTIKGSMLNMYATDFEHKIEELLDAEK